MYLVLGLMPIKDQFNIFANEHDIQGHLKIESDLIVKDKSLFPLNLYFMVAKQYVKTTEDFTCI